MVTFIPGVGRTSADLAGWLDRLPGSSVADYPRLENPTLDGYVEHFARVIPPGSFVVGESLGGLVALGLAGRGYPGLAVDPPLTTAKQWTLHLAMRTRAFQIKSPIFDALISNLFGYLPDGTVEDRVYYPMLAQVRAPFSIVTGDVPLHPQRGEPTRPCMIDAVDGYVLEASRVDLFQVKGGHALLVENVEALTALIIDRVAPSTPT